MQQIGGLIGDLIIFGVFIYGALLLHGVVNTSNKELQIKIMNFRHKKLPYVIVWGGIISFSFLIIERLV